MFFVTFSSLWSFAFFFFFTYTTFVISVVIYLLPIVAAPTKYSAASTRSRFSYITGSEILWVLISPYFLFVLSTFLWSAPAVSAWFGHVLFTSFQSKVTWLVILSFMFSTLVMSSSVYFTARGVYDYIITTFGFCYWLVMLFTSNSIFTAIFVIEVLSALLFLLLVTSSFSSAYFYRNLNLSFGHVLHQVTPYTYLQSVLFFFWVSLISSLNLFLFCLLFYVKVLTFDWYLLEYVFLFFTNIATPRDVYALGFGWAVLVFCIFLKCGLAPFYIWKPTFFKGIPLYTLFFYVTFFYFFLFLFIINLLVSYFTEVLYFYSFVTTVFTTIGLLFLLSIMCESFYIKVFLAVSSILNSLFVVLALSASHTTDVFLLWL